MVECQARGVKSELKCPCVRVCAMNKKHYVISESKRNIANDMQ